MENDRSQWSSLQDPSQPSPDGFHMWLRTVRVTDPQTEHLPTPGPGIITLGLTLASSPLRQVQQPHPDRPQKPVLLPASACLSLCTEP